MYRYKNTTLFLREQNKTDEHPIDFNIIRRTDKIKIRQKKMLKTL